MSSRGDLPRRVFRGASGGETYGPGWCYLEKFVGNEWEAGKLLKTYPTVEEFLMQRDAARRRQDKLDEMAGDDEFGPWVSILPGESEQTETYWDDPGVGLSVVSSGVNLYHVIVEPASTRSLFEQVRLLPKQALIGAFISDMVSKGAEVTGTAQDFLVGVLSKTNALNEDAAENYFQLGNCMEQLNDSGGVKEIARANFVEIVKSVVSRWTSAREASAAANVAAATLYSETEWSPKLFEEAMEADEDEDVRQSRLMSMAGMYLVRNAQVHWSQWILRRKFTSWRSDLLGPAKAFARAVGVGDDQFDGAVTRAIATGHPFLLNAVETLKAAAMPAAVVLAKVAAGGIVAAGVIVSAGILMDWYYLDKEQHKLGAVRETVGEVYGVDRIIARAQESYAVSAILSDESYDTTDHTHVVRLDPFFHTIKGEISQLKDDTAATRLVSNTFIAPLINTASTTAKNVLLLPATVSNESAQHLQKAFPMFYFRIVNRTHSHPELWAARRAFELMVARALVADKQQDPVVMIGANVRQVSKMPRVAINFGPVLSGRDEARHVLSGTVKQRNYYAQKTIGEKFSYDTVFSKFNNGIAVSFYSTQDVSRQEFIETCIKSGISRAYVAVNIPVIMMDERIEQWEDTVLNTRFVKRGETLSMSVLGMPVAGYDNSFSKTMSWVKPHRPVFGYDATVEALAQVGSSYLLYVQIGVGPQESHDTLWKMPDSGHYVLPDLTREEKKMKFFTVPEAKFDQVVKYVVQLNGSKNLFESTTGRILGLEAAVRIGGVTLDKSWRLSHREFVSVAVHAISCAGIDKADAMIMVGQLRQFFTERGKRTWQESVKNGYRKLFGIEKDNRLPGLAIRGRHDYDVVTHWTCRQRSGNGWGEKFASDIDSSGSDWDSDDTAASSVDENDVRESKEDIRGEDLNQEDAGGAKSEDGAGGEGFFDFFSKWRKPKTSRTDLMENVGDVSTSMRLVLPEGSLEDYTSSSFNPSGALNFSESVNQSKSNALFLQAFGSHDDLAAALVEKAEFPAPDQGAVRVCEMALKVDRPHLSLSQTTLQMPSDNFEEGFLGDLQRAFFKGFDADQLAAPALMLDGLAGSAKSSVLRALVKESKKSAVTVVPSRKLSRDWRDHKVGTVVTRHGLLDSVLRGRHWLVIDEVYAYTKAELACYLSRAARANVRVFLLGDRKQQYEDGAEITVEDVTSLGVPIMRMLVSNTMPLDALQILKWAAEGDKFLSLFQTRNPKQHSIYFVGHNHVSFDWVGKKEFSNAIVYKDKLEPRLGWERTDEELGFRVDNAPDWLSVSRAQGSRTEFAFMLCSAITKSERWFSNQRGMFYVATSRHSKGMVMGCFQHDLGDFDGLQFEQWSKVDGRLTKVQAKECMDAPFKTYQSRRYKESPILELMQQRGMIPQLEKIASLGPIKEDWRPWPKAESGDKDNIRQLVQHNFLTLVGEAKPYAETDAVKYPVFAQAMGLWSVRRPDFVKTEPIQAVFEGMNRLAVNQTSKDEVLDLKNVVERTARPRHIEHEPAYIKAEGERLFGEVLAAFFDEDRECDFSRAPMASDWVDGRSADFSRKFMLSDSFGLTSASVRSYGFLKTQVKVKVKRSFALEENYGQTVLASPPDYNAMLGPWSKTFLRNVRLGCRTGVFLDSGYSDADLARGLRDCGAFARFLNENYQADVKRQDTSHTPVTLRVFRLALEHFGVPAELAELYERQSTFYRYRSLHSGLYDGQAENNLGSGDPFTLIRNIFEVLTVMVERFGVVGLRTSTIIVKGDDYLSDTILPMLPVSVPEIRATQLTEDFNKPPYHAGRFLLEASIVPDPVRMICKAMTKLAKDMDRVNQLAQAFYDRYVALSESDFNYLKYAVREAYSDFEPSLLDCVLELYLAMRDRSLFYDLVQAENYGERLVVQQKDTDCAAYALSFFTDNEQVIEAARNESADEIELLCIQFHIPVFRVKDRPNDLKKRGVWLSENHAWAVINLEEFSS